MLASVKAPSLPLNINEADEEVSVKYLVELAREAGEMIAVAAEKRKDSTDFVVSTKSSVCDLVTEHDEAVQSFLINSIKSKFPHHSFICEEGNFSENEFTDNPTWIIDPIDGTTNFVNNNPFCCVSIGFTRNKIIQLGAVYSPFLGELYFAVKNGGSYVSNGKDLYNIANQLKVSRCKSLGEGIVSTGFSMSQIQRLKLPNLTDEETKQILKIKERNLKNFSALVESCRGVRSYAAYALDLCFLAAGRLDGFFAFGPFPWDIAAGTLIVTEANGYVSDVDGVSPLAFSKNRMIAANSSQVAKEIASIITI